MSQRFTRAAPIRDEVGLTYEDDMDLVSLPSRERSFDLNLDGREDDATARTEESSLAHARLYALCENAVRSSDGRRARLYASNENSVLGANGSAEEREAVDRAWNAIRGWFRAHPSSDERSEAVSFQGVFLSTALHLVCNVPDPPTDIVETLIRCSRETVTWADGNGWLPIHLASANGASAEVLQVLLQAFPESKVAQDKELRTPLHFAVLRNVEIVNVLVADSAAAEIADQRGMLPIHYACAYGTSTAVLEAVIAAYPDCIEARDCMGRTPFHLAVVNSHRPSSPSVVGYLLSLPGSNVVNMADRYGSSPIHLFRKADRLLSEQTEERSHVSACLKLYLDARPEANADFLTTVQALPDWLKDTAVVSPHIQNVLNKKIVQRFPTLLLILDGYMLLITIICFDVAASESIDYRFSGIERKSFGALVTVFLGGSYFFLRETIQMISLWSLGLIRSYFKDFTNWLDMTLIVLVLYCGAAMADENLGNDEQFRSLVAVTKAVLWGSVISFLKSTLVDFAVFVGGVIYVVRCLGAFLICLGVLLCAFAQAFWFVYLETGNCTFDRSVCESDTTTDQAQLCYEEFPHCNFWSSSLKVYTMLMGEIGDESRYSTSRAAQALYILFAFLVVILLSNVLIAIVTDSYDVIKNDRAAIVFWSNRLDFVAEVDVIGAVRDYILSFCFSRKESGTIPSAPSPVAGIYGENVAVAGGNTRTNRTADASRPHAFSEESFRNSWDHLMSLFERQLFDNPADPEDRRDWSEKCCLLFLRIWVAVCVIPAWLGAGFVTAGWLWPPQVREFLFVQQRTATSRADLSQEVLLQMGQLKEEMKHLRYEFRDQVNRDHRELLQMKAEMDVAHGAVMSDLRHVKEFMTSLLEMGRSQKQVLEARASAGAIAAASRDQEGREI